MYEKHYQVLEDPFKLTPDDKAAYEHRNYLSGKAFLQHIIADSEKSVVVISGVPGVGKSTLINGLLQQQQRADISSCLLHSSQINTHGCLHSLAAVLDLSDSDSDSESDDKLLQKLDRYLAKQASQNQCSILVIDDADELDSDALFNVGQLTRIIHDHHYPAKIFLVGNEHLRQLLQSTHADAQHNRFITGWNLEGLAANEIEAYVKHRLQNAGGSGLLRIEDEAWDKIYRFSDGIPRRVNRICSRLLIDGLFENKLVFTNEEVVAAITNLDNEGLLELSSNIASLHGLVGIARSETPASERVDINAFLSGFADIGPTSSADDEDVDGSALNIRIVANDLHAESADESGLRANMQADEIHTPRPDINEILEADTTTETPRARKGVFVFLFLLLLAVAFTYTNSTFFDRSADVPGTDSLSPPPVRDATVSAVDEYILRQQPEAADDSSTVQSIDSTTIDGKTAPLEAVVSLPESVTAAGLDTPGKSVDSSAITDEREIADAIEELAGQPTDVTTTDQATATDLAKQQDQPVNQVVDEGAIAAHDSGSAANVPDQVEAEVEGKAETIARPADVEETVVTQSSEDADNKATKDPQHVQSDEIAVPGKPQQAVRPASKKVALPGFSADQLKRMLLAGYWHRNGSPALLLPSELNRCSDNGLDIYCLTKKQKPPSTQSAEIEQTGAMIENFAADGTFKVLYRSNRTDAQISTRQLDQSAIVPEGPAAIQEYEMSCRFDSSSVIHCLNEGIRVRYVRRFKNEY